MAEIKLKQKQKKAFEIWPSRQYLGSHNISKIVTQWHYFSVHAAGEVVRFARQHSRQEPGTVVGIQ